MGLLMNLLTLPVTGPFRGAMWIVKTLAERAEHEMYDEGAVRAQLMELELRYDLKEINEEEYLAAEDELLVQLKAIREHHAAAKREI